MDRNDGDWAALDDAYAEFSRSSEEQSDPWLLEQTISNAPERRNLLSTLPIASSQMTVLDVGTGYGPMAFEIAHLTPATVIGIDLDERSLGTARAVAQRLESWIHPGASVRFERCDLGALSDELIRIAPDVATAGNPGFDLAVVRLVLQHHNDPVDAVTSITDVIRHSGYLWIFDVDDGLSASWPPISPARDELETAFKAWQRSYGGDREIGRKLPAIMSASNLLVHEVRCNTTAVWMADRPGDRARAGVAGRLRNAMRSMVDGGFIDAKRCADLLVEIEHEPATVRLQVETQFIVIAQKP